MNTHIHLKDNLRVCVIGGGNAAHVLAALLSSRGIPTNILASGRIEYQKGGKK